MKLPRAELYSITIMVKNTTLCTKVGKIYMKNYIQFLLENLFVFGDHLDFMKNVYLAAPLFSDAECDFNSKLRDELERIGLSVFLPQEHSNDSIYERDARQESIFSKNVTAIEKADILVAVLDGVDVDSGTAWEIGYAHALGKPVCGLRTDFRTLGIEGTVNLMIERSVVLCTGLGELLERLEFEQ